MKAKGRYCVVAVALAAAYAVFVWTWLKTKGDAGRSSRVDPALLEWIDNLPNFDDELMVDEKRWEGVSTSSSCLMETCFDFSRCPGPPFLHHVYPSPDSVPLPSRSYSKILSLLRDSPLHTDDPSRACLFFVAVDTLDRDRKGENYVEGLRTRIPELEHWNNGTNHVIFNLFSGTYPDYREDELNFDPGRAILAKASFSGQKYRPGFDISLPLFHADHPARDGTSGTLKSNNFPVRNDVMLGFKVRCTIHA